MRYISLFSGIGGLDAAIDSLGGECWVQVEKEPYCRSILDLRYPDVPKVDNIFGWHATADTVDLVVGGPPCQPVSHAGRRKGTEDDRWLWGEALRIVAEAKPARVFFENPMGLRTMGLDAILAELTDMGYGGAWEVVAAADVGAPHLRKRIFIMGIAGRTGWEGPTRPPGNRKAEWNMPTPTARLGGQRGPQAKRYFDPARSNDLDDYVAAYPAATIDQGLPCRTCLHPLSVHVDGYDCRACDCEAAIPPREALPTGLDTVLVAPPNAKDVTPYWPTPSAGDNRDRGHSEMPAIIRRRAKGKQLNLSMTVSTERGALSPDWVSWLMGFPIGWDDINVTEPGPLYGWEEEPDIPRVGLGINNRSKRLTALGNAVVAAQAVFAWNRLTERLG